MDRPKVPHNWRELGREIGIIVVGVLIALFFGQLVDFPNGIPSGPEPN